jgi:hypothetical protein
MSSRILVRAQIPAPISPPVEAPLSLLQRKEFLDQPSHNGIDDLAGNVWEWTDVRPRLSGRPADNLGLRLIVVPSQW